MNTVHTASTLQRACGRRRSNYYQRVNDPVVFNLILLHDFKRDMDGWRSANNVTL